MATKTTKTPSGGVFAKTKALVGKKVLVQFQKGPGRTQDYNTIEVEATIRDYKHAYGRDRYLIEPVAGRGQTWIQDFKPLSR